MARRFRTISMLALAIPLLLATGCFRGEGGDDCEPGKKVACVCGDDSSGTRTCNSDGVYGDCDCGGGGDGGTSDGGGGCPAGWDLCSDLCVNVLDDPRTCGNCTTACATGEVCLGGNCETGGDCRQEPCIGVTFCDETTGLCMPGCSENAHCPPGEYCDLTPHACDCIPGTDRCGLNCVDTLSDPNFCGDCVTTCPPGATCAAGECACPPGTEDCGGTCVDTSSDALHCGSCNRICDSRATCLGSDCACPGAEELCDEVCTDTQSDPAHCNRCNLPCPVGEACVSGSCEPPPDCRVDGCTGFTWCDNSTGVCQPGCGSDAQCRPDQTCLIANHSCVCPSGLQDCNGTACVDTSSDAAHCSGCNRPCPGGQSCAGSTCVDPSQACNGYDEGNRAAVCPATTCTGDMECVVDPFSSSGVCLDETPCGSSPAGPCCGVDEYCGSAIDLLGTGLSNICCVPGESFPGGIFGGLTCTDSGLDLTCVNDADCPDAWGIGHCNTSVNPALCAECSSDAHCPGERCHRPTGTCSECVGASDCPPVTPVCDTSGTCVGCRNDGDCNTSAAPACDTSQGVCVACTENFHCGFSTPYCDTGSFSCVECLDNSGCGGATPNCDNGSCVICPGGDTCQTMQSGRRACYSAPIFPFPCGGDGECFLVADTICDAPTGESLICVLPCP